MNKTPCLILVSVIITAMLVSASISGTFSASVYAKSKDSKAKDAIVKAIGKSVEGKWSKIDVASYSIFDSNNTITPYNKTKTSPVVPPTPPSCKTGEHLEGGKCVPDVIPSDGNSTIVCIAGDISGDAVIKAMKVTGCEVTIALGDLGYKSDLASFKAQGFTKCVIGNHDASEDGGSTIVKEAKAYCGETWWLKIGTGTIFIGVNTNGNLDTQLGTVQGWLRDSQLMAGINSVHIVSHKPICAVPPNSHHKLELGSTFCDGIVSYAPGVAKLYFENGHNHVYAETSDGFMKTIGNGGRSHYDCGTNAIWVYCNNKDYGFYKYKIDNIDGTTVGNLISTAGKVLR